jgi:hypothetical protein
MMLENPDSLKWKFKIKQIRKNAIPKNESGQMHQRLLGYSSLLCYSLSDRLIAAKNYKQASFMVNCYKIADPDNSEAYFLSAIIEGANSDKKSCLQFLTKAIELGFNDKKRLINQKEFDFLSSSPEFEMLLK